MPNDVNLRQAADGVQNLARQYKGVLALAEAVGKMADLENHRNELERQRDAAKAELDGVLASLNTAKKIEELEKAKAKAQTELDRAKGAIENSQAALLGINRDRAAAEDSVKALRAEAGEVEKRLTEMRADIDAMKERFGK